LRPATDRLFEWILGLGPGARYNLTSSGLSEPVLSSMGVDTSFERFASEKDEHLRVFTEDVAALYGVSPENVVVTSGASEAIFLVYSVLGHARAALVPLPNYGPMFTVPRALGLEVRNSLSSAGRREGAIFGLTDPNNPTGRGLEPGAVRSLTTGRGGNTVFINETYREFTFHSSPVTHFDGTEDVVTCSTMTKFYGLGRLRVGWILAGPKAARVLAHGKWATSGHDSEFSLWLASQALRRRQAFVDCAREIRDRNLRLVREFLEGTKGVSAQLGDPPFCLVRYRRGPGSVAFAKGLLEKRGVLVSPGDFFEAPRSFRLCYTADEHTMRAGLAELSGYIDGMARG
jgi:aspartate/methionine/tyrosine aminotransferase